MQRHRSSTETLINIIDQTLTNAMSDQDFMFVDENKLSYETLAERMARLNCLFQQMGLRPGDRIAILSDDDLAVVTIFFAALRSGLTTIIGDGMATADEVVALTQAADPAALFADGQILEAVGNQIELSEDKIVQLLSVGEGSAPALNTVRQFPHLLADIKPLSDYPEVPEETVALIVFTSGTTSHPKGVCLTHANLCAQLEIFGNIYGFNERSRILNVLPLHHVDGLIRGPLATMRFGGQLFRPMRFSIPNIPNLLSCVTALGITHFVAVPAMLNLINRLAENKSTAFNVPTFEFVICSADLLEPVLWRSFEEKFCTLVVNAYGLSEVVCDVLFCGPSAETRRIGTLGKPADCQIRVVDETGNDQNVGEVGELILNGPIVMDGYFREPEETAQVLRDGWFYTGDLVSLDQEGFVTFQGRKKTVVISKGATINPENITTVLYGMPEVAEAVCFGIQDPIWGERLAACVVLEPAATITTTDIVNYCRQNLAPEKVPAEIHILAELPRGPSGKVKIDAVGDLVTAKDGAGGLSADVYSIAAECFQVSVDILTPESSPYNTEGWDSLAHLVFINRLEEEFEFICSPAEIIELGSLADAENIVARSGNATQQ